MSKKLGKLRHEENRAVFAILICLFMALRSYTNGELVDSSLGQLNEAIGCPLEYYHDIRSSQGANGSRDDSQDVIVSGHELASECYSSHKDSRVRLHPNEFFVFPSQKRVCQPNGIWSEVPPACVRKISDVQSETHDDHRYFPKEIYLCDDSKCPQANEIWQRVGRLHSSCSSSVEAETLNDSFEYLQVYAEFYQHVHLSYMTFNLADNSGRITRPFRVEVNVHPNDVIRHLSQESGHFLANHYDSFVGNRENGKQNDICAIVEIGAYTKRVLLRFYVEKTAESEANPDVSLMLRWRQRPMFYGVNPSKQLGRGCPQPPSIPFGMVTDKEEAVAITFTCQPGYTLIDPVTNAPSNGRIECLNGLEWGPYPFPICNPSSNIHDKQPAKPAVYDERNEFEQHLNPNEGVMPNGNDETIPLKVIGTSSKPKREQSATIGPQEVENETITPIMLGTENDPIVMIVLGSLFAFGIVCGIACTFICKKLFFRKLFCSLQQQVIGDSKDARHRQLARNISYDKQGGYHLKGNRFSAAYTIISNSSSDSSTYSEHLYEQINPV